MKSYNPSVFIFVKGSLLNGNSVQANLPKEIADYLNKMGARIPNIKPGKATIEYLTKIQASTRFWGLYLNLSSIMCNFNFIPL